MMLRRSFLSMALCLPLLAGGLPLAAPRTAHADTGPDGRAAEARQFIETLADRAIATVADRNITQRERDERFRSLFVSSFDLPEIGRFVLGRFWRGASPEQQQEFLRMFEEMSVLTWSKRFGDYSGERLEPLSVVHDGDRGWLVDSRILRVQGQPIPVQWRLREGSGGLRIVDIIVEGVSMAITQRSDYGAAMQANGGNLDALLQSIRTKIDQMRASG